MRLQLIAVMVVSFLMAGWWPYVVWADAKPATAPATSPAVSDQALNQAKQHFEAGRNAYNAGDYLTAIREFKAAESLRPSPILAYNIGLANEKLGKKRVALKYFHRYLEQMPNAQNRAEVEGRINTLEQAVAAEPPPPPPGQNGQPTAEQPGDMPPPPAAQTPSQPGFDPYASTAPTNAAPPPPQKKKSLWWVWLIVAGGSAIVIAVVVALAVVYGDNSTVLYSADRAMLSSPRDPASVNRRTPDQLLPLFHF